MNQKTFQRKFPWHSQQNFRRKLQRTIQEEVAGGII